MAIENNDGQALSLNADNVVGGHLKKEFGGLGPIMPGLEGNSPKSVGGEWASVKGTYIMSATNIDLATASTVSLFTVPSTITFVPTEYVFYSNSVSAMLASASAVFSLSAVTVVDTNTMTNPLSGSYIRKSISSCTGIPASTVVKLNLTTSVSAASCTGSIYMIGFCI